MELIRKEGRLARSIRRKEEKHAELKAAAASTGSFHYDQEKVTGPAPEGSRHELLVLKYLELESEIEEEKIALEEVTGTLRQLISILPPRERRLMMARHLDHMDPEEVMERFGLSYEQYRQYHSRAIKRLEKEMDNCHNI